MTAKLTTHEPGNDRTFEVTEAGITIGRHADNQASLDDSRLSRFHAKIKFKDGAWYAEDLGSTNGSFLNDKKFDGEVKISRGDKLRFGATAAELEWEETASAAAPAPAPAPQKVDVPEKAKEAAESPDVKTAATIVAPLSSLVKDLPEDLKPAVGGAIRKPVIGGGLRPGLKLPPKPAGLKPGLKLPPKPAGLKPGLKLPPKPPALKLPPKPGAGA